MAQVGGLTVTITGDASGVDAALQQMSRVIADRMSAIEARMAAGERATQQFSDRSAKHLQGIERSVESLAKRFDLLGSAIVSFFAAFQTSGALTGFLQEIALTAARTETLQVVLMKVAQNAGVTALQAGVARDRIKELGVTTQEASSITARFIQANLGLENAIKLANVARNAAVVADQNTSQALSGLVQGILTLQQETLRTYGIFVNLEQANDAFAKSTGRTADKLTVYEKQQVALNAVLTQGIALNGTYEAALGTVGKQITSLTRVVEESRNVLGANYLPILGQIITAITNLLIGFQQLPQSVQTATAAILGASAAVGALTVAVAALVRIGQALAISSLFTGWGVVILAIGAATAAAIALTKALRSVGEVDPATVLKQSTAAIDERIRSTQTLLSAQTSSLQKMQEQLKTTPESKAGAEIIARQTLRVQELQNALDALRVTRDQLAKPVPLPPPKPQPPAPPDPGKGLQAAVNTAKAEEAIIEQSLKRQEALIAQSFDERRAQADAFLAEEIRQAPGEAEQIQKAHSEQTRIMAQEEATLLEQVRIASNNRLLAATVDRLNQEKAAHAGKVADLAKIEGELLVAYDKHGTEQEQIFAKTAAVRQRLSKQATDEEIKDLIRVNDMMEKAREQGLEDFARQTRRIDEEMAREQAQMQESQLRSYENFVNRVAGMLNDIFTGLLEGTLSAVDFFKKLLIAQLANIASSVIAPFVAGIAASVATALGSALPTSLGQVVTQGVFGPAGAPQGGLSGVLGMAGTAGQGAGMINSLFGGQGVLGKAFSWFGDQLDTAGTALADLFGVGERVASPELIASLPEGTASLPPGVMSGMGVLFRVLGGLGGLGGGIFTALNARNVGGMAGGAVGAAGGATALAATLVPTLLGGLAPMLGPIGLALAAIAPLLGNFLGQMSAPAGPRFALGGLGGVGVGTGPGGLQVTGGVTATIGRSARLPSGVNTAAIQESLTASVSRMLTGMVEAINKVAIDPEDLLRPTQRALDNALTGALTINSSSAKNFQKDMEEQLKFVGVQVSSFFLRPLNEAFRQLETTAIDQQLARLPETTAGMTQVFKAMNDQLNDLSKVANTDVLRQLSSVRNRVEDFGNALADTTRVVAESIVGQITGELVSQAQGLLDQPLATQVNRFSGLMTRSLQALSALTTTQRSLESVGLNAGGTARQIEILSRTMTETAATVSTEIVTGALQGLSANLQTILVQPLRVQATTVNALFTDSMAALQALWTEWHRLAEGGVDTTRMQQQFNRLLGGIFDTAQQALSEAFRGGDFGEFLAVLGSIPEAVTNLNPVWAQLRQLGAVFAQVVGPMVQKVGDLQDELRTTAARVTFTADRISELRGALVDAGAAAERALPLYAQLAQALEANAAAQIQVIHEQAEVLRELTTADVAAQRAAIDREVNRVEDFWNTWADGARAALDAQVAADRRALDIQVAADRAALNTRIDNERTAVAREVDRVTDFWQTWADAERAALDAWVDATTTMVNTWADSATTTANQLKRVNEAILAEQSPAQQRAALEAQRAGLVTLINATGSQAAITELINVDQQLLALAKQSNNLAGIQSVLDELASTQRSLTTSLATLTGQTDPFMASLVVEQVQADWLAAIAAYQQTQTDRIQTALEVQLGALTAEQEIQTARLVAAQQAQADAIEAGQQAQSDAITANQQAQTDRIQQTLDDQLGALQLAAQAQLDYLTTQEATALQAIATWEEAQVRAIKEDLITQLRVLEAALQNLFAGQQIVQSLLRPPVAVTVAGQGGVQAAGGQRGGIIGLASGQYYAQGGLVPGRFEPGERIYFPPVPAGVAAMNRDVPRFSRGGGFTVPGSGSGDSFAALVPDGSFALNKRASGAMGFQSGGMVVQGSSTVGHSITINVDLRGAQVRSESDYRRLTGDFRDAVREALREIERRRPKRGR